MPIVRIPTPLRPMAQGKDEVQVDGATVGAVIDDLERRHPGFKGRLLDGQGAVRRFVNLYVGEDDCRHLQGLSTPIAATQVLSIVPAIAGGAGGGPASALTAAARSATSGLVPVTSSEWIDRLRASTPQLTTQELVAELKAGKRPVLIDVRESDEVAEGRLPGALSVPRGFLELRIEDEVTDKDADIVAYCGGGTRSLLAAEALGRLGYTKVRSLKGGFRGWAEAKQPIETPRTLSDAEKRRYSRHLMIPEVGEAGQVKLLQSKVLLLGAGGLGCPAAIYLAAAGVGTLGVVDSDVVDESNLQRQILHPTDRVGTSKVESAKASLLAMNPGITVQTFEERVTSANVDRIIEGFDLVVDGTDNFPTRYLVNDACVKHRKPCVHGSVYRFEGQVTVFDPARSDPSGKGFPCYRCLYPEPPPPELAPSCADAGVLGVLPGVIGLLQAVEALKLLLGKGDPLVGRLLAYDALAAKFRELRLRKAPDCKYCASLHGAPFPGYIDYAFFCSTAGGDAH